MKTLFVALLGMTVMPFDNTSWLTDITGWPDGPYAGGYGVCGCGSWPSAGFSGPGILAGSTVGLAGTLGMIVDALRLGGFQ